MHSEAPRPEPRTARGRATRDRILCAATRLIAERGVAGTSLEDVRLAAEASKSQLYLYFADREDLLRAVARATSDEVLEAQAGALADFRSREGIRAYFDGLVEMQTTGGGHGGCPIGSLAGQLAETDDAAREALADGMRRWEAGLTGGLQALAADGDLGPEADPARLGVQVLALIQGGLLLTQLHRDPSCLRHAVDGAAVLIEAARAPQAAKT